ncbi:MAG: DUF3301 domain-containing protein [Gammaproteobacteria bacterium]|nr:DUF3301 domain-containing protein [Gammaproteobacteria bacterium]
MLSIKSLLILTALFLAGLALWHQWHARERAERLAREICRRMGVQFLDESVGQIHWRIVRDQGRWKLRRTYAFEFSRTGSDRWPGELFLLDGQLAGVEFNLVESATISPRRPALLPPPRSTTRSIPTGEIVHETLAPPHLPPAARRPLKRLCQQTQ